jgi:hypothetical protein
VCVCVWIGGKARGGCELPGNVREPGGCMAASSGTWPPEVRGLSEISFKRRGPRGEREAPPFMCRHPGPAAPPQPRAQMSRAEQRERGGEGVQRGREGRVCRIGSNACMKSRGVGKSPPVPKLIHWVALAGVHGRLCTHPSPAASLLPLPPLPSTHTTHLSRGEAGEKVRVRV